MRLLSLYSSDLKFTKSIHISKSLILAVSKCLDCSGLLENQSYWHKGQNHLIAHDLKKKKKIQKDMDIKLCAIAKYITEPRMFVSKLAKKKKAYHGITATPWTCSPVDNK